MEEIIVPPPPALHHILPLFRAGELVMKCTFNNIIGLIVYERRERNHIISEMNNVNLDGIHMSIIHNPAWRCLIVYNGIKIFLRSEEDIDDFEFSDKEFSREVECYKASQLLDEEEILG